MKDEPFDSFELERIQLRQTMIRKARNLLESGKNLSEVAKVLRSERYPISYEQLREMVDKGQLPDNFKKAQELVKELCTKQGLTVDEITKVLQERKLNYTKQWVGRWISENDWKCPESKEQPAESAANLTTTEPESSATTSEPLIPVIEPEPEPVVEMKVTQGTAIRLLQRITGRFLNKEDVQIPDEWTSNIPNTKFIPLQLINKMFGSDLTDAIQSYIDFKSKEKDKISTCLRILERITSSSVKNADFIKIIETNIGKSSFSPIALVSKVLKMNSDEILAAAKLRQQDAAEAIKNALALLDDVEKAQSQVVVNKEGQVEEIIHRFPAGTPMEDILKAPGNLGVSSVGKTYSEMKDWKPSFWDMIETTQDAEKLFGHLLGTFKILTLGDVIRLPLGPWPDQNTLDLLEDVWVESRFQFVTSSSMQVTKLVGESDGEVRATSDSKLVYVPNRVENGLETFRAALRSWYEGTHSFFPDDIDAWLVILNVLSVLNFDYMRRKEPITLTRGQILFKHFDFASVAHLFKQLAKAKALKEIETPKGPAYLPDDMKITSKLNDIYTYIKSGLKYNVLDRKALLFTLDVNESAPALPGGRRFPSTKEAVTMLELLKELPKPNEACFCGSKKKFKKCHKDWF